MIPDNNQQEKKLKTLIIISICSIFLGFFLWSCFELKSYNLSRTNYLTNTNTELLLRTDDNRLLDNNDRRSRSRLYFDNKTGKYLPKILCFIMTIENGNEIKKNAVKSTWGKRCDKLLFVENGTHFTETDGILRVPIKHESRQELWHKIIFAISYIYENYLDQYDWFFKADDDTYVIMENLKEFLSIKSSPNEPIYFGHKFKRYVEQGYMSGGSGYVLSKKALKLLYEIGFKQKLEDCNMNDGYIEDVEIGYCLQALNVKAGDTRDHKGKQTFLPLPPEFMINTTKLIDDKFWYQNYTYYTVDKEDTSAISDKPISFHYIIPDAMYTIDWLLYKVKSDMPI